MNKANDTCPLTLNVKSLETKTNNAISTIMLAMRIDMTRIVEHCLLLSENSFELANLPQI